MQEVDAVIRERLASDVALIDQISTNHQRRRQAHPAAPGAAVRRRLWASRARSATNWRPSSNSSTPPRCCTTTWWTSRRCAAAAQTANAHVRQRGQRAGGRLPLFPRLPDDGVGEPHARAGGAGRRHQRHRRGRSAAVDEHARPRPGRRRTTCASSASRPPSCSRPAPAWARCWPAPTSTSKSLRRLRPLPGHRLPAGRRPAGLRGRHRTSWARTSATTCAKASRPCRC